MKWSMIHQRGSAFHLRVLVRTRLQASLGRKEIWKSLYTSDLATAEARPLARRDKLRAGFGLPQRATENVAPLSPQEFAREYLAPSLADDARLRVEKEGIGRTPDADEVESDVPTTRLERSTADPKAAYTGARIEESAEHGRRTFARSTPHGC